jgi:hypothetical protein
MKQYLNYFDSNRTNTVILNQRAYTGLSLSFESSGTLQVMGGTFLSDSVKILNFGQYLVEV